MNLNHASRWPATALLVLFCALPASAQTEQVWPEVGVYVKVNPHLRLHLVASGTRENNQGTDLDLGADIDFYLKPLVELKRLAGFQLDESKSRPLRLRAGYHVLPSINSATEQRVVLEAEPRYPLKAGVVVSDRNRADLRFIQGKFSWRYRNRLTVEREFAVRAFRFTPYVRVEPYYDSNHQKWSRTATTAGFVFSIRKHAELEMFYEHQNETGKSPNRQVNALGLTLNLHF